MTWDVSWKLVHQPIWGHSSGRNLPEAFLLPATSDGKPVRYGFHTAWETAPLSRHGHRNHREESRCRQLLGQEGVGLEDNGLLYRGYGEDRGLGKEDLWKGIEKRGGIPGLSPITEPMRYTSIQIKDHQGRFPWRLSLSFIRVIPEASQVPLNKNKALPELHPAPLKPQAFS